MTRGVWSAETLGAAALAALVLASLAAPWLAPQDPLLAAGISLADAEQPPLSSGASGQRFLLGTDGQGRDVLSLVLHGTRISVAVGVLSLLVALAIGLPLGLAAGYAKGWIDSVVMRAADAQLSLPAMLIALTLDGLAGAILRPGAHAPATITILSAAIGLSQWAVIARTVRASTMVEHARDYAQAAHAAGAGAGRVMFRHLLPNVSASLLALAAVQLASAVLTEATLSFLGVGLPPTSPSLGTLVRQGSDFLLAGRWWMAAFPGLALVVFAGSVNALGDQMQTRLTAPARH